MPILKALRRLVTPQFVKPEWIRWIKDPDGGWEFHTDGFGGDQCLSIDFNSDGGNVKVTIDDDVREASYRIPWADPECDLKVVKILKDWFVKLWEENYLEQAGYPNPSCGGVRSES